MATTSYTTNPEPLPLQPAPPATSVREISLPAPLAVAATSKQFQRAMTVLLHGTHSLLHSPAFAYSLPSLRARRECTPRVDPDEGADALEARAGIASAAIRVAYARYRRQGFSDNRGNERASLSISSSVSFKTSGSTSASGASSQATISATTLPPAAKDKAASYESEFTHFRTALRSTARTRRSVERGMALVRAARARGRLVRSEVLEGALLAASASAASSASSASFAQGRATETEEGGTETQAEAEAEADTGWEIGRGSDVESSEAQQEGKSNADGERDGLADHRVVAEILESIDAALGAWDAALQSAGVVLEVLLALEVHVKEVHLERVTQMITTL